MAALLSARREASMDTEGPGNWVKWTLRENQTEPNDPWISLQKDKEEGKVDECGMERMERLEC